MTRNFCCIHSKKASDLMESAYLTINGTSASEVERNGVGQIFRTFIPFASTYDKSNLHSAIKDYKR